MAIRLGSQEEWLTSSYSQGSATCVQVRSTEPTSLEVNDSKLPDDSIAFQSSPEIWELFIGFVRNADVKI
jgi:hypothetical protein